MTIIIMSNDDNHCRPQAARLLLSQKKMAPVLVLVDLSNSSLNAAKYAADVSAALHTRLIMVNVVQLAEVCLSLSGEETDFYKVQNKRVAWLNELKKHLLARTDNKIEIESIILHGEPESELKKFCASQTPVLFVSAMGTTDHDAHVQSNINIAGLLEDIKCPLLIVPSNSFYQGFRRVTVISNQNQSATDLVSLTHKWLGQFNDSQEPEINVRPLIKFALVDLASKEKVDVVINATQDAAGLDMLLHSIQTSSNTENHAPAVLSIDTTDLYNKTFSKNVSGAKGHDCSVCNGACRAKKSIINAEILSK